MFEGEQVTSRSMSAPLLTSHEIHRESLGRGEQIEQIDLEKSAKRNDEVNTKLLLD